MTEPDSASYAGMLLTLAEARFFLDVRKRLFDITAWERAGNREGRAEKHILEARIAIDGVLPRGLWFRCIVYPQSTETATFQLDCDRPDARSHHTLYRMDWHPVNAHQNGYHGPPEFHGLLFPAGRSHDHTCLDQAIDSEGRISSGELQCARPVDEAFRGFREALAFVCVKLHIQNCDDIPAPIYQPSLL